MELSCLMCSGRRDHNCRDLQLIFSKPKYRVVFLSVSNYWKFLTLLILFFSLRLVPIIGGAKPFLILEISIKSVWMFLRWLQMSLLFCSNVSKSLSWSLSITLSVLSCTLLSYCYMFLNRTSKQEGSKWTDISQKNKELIVS